MLATAPVKNLAYYEDLASEDYYLKGGEPPGQWFGQVAERLGLSGQVNADHLSNLMRGYSPDGKKSLCQNAGKENRVPAYDNVFSPAKSISIAWAGAAHDERMKIQQAHDTAVRSALIFLEQHAAYSRRGHNGGELEKTSGFLVATYQHSTSREQDMHLHTHALILNVAEREDKSWGAIFGRSIYTWRLSASAIYQSQLAKEIRKLGFMTRLTEDGKAFEIEGISSTICKHFSKRSNQIETELKKYGAISRASSLGDKITKHTRRKKTEIDRPALFSGWQHELFELGFDLKKIKSMALEHTQTESLNIKFDTQTLLERLSETLSVFKEADIYKEAALLALATGHSGNQAQLLAQKTLENENLISLGVERHNFLFTTKSILQAEQEMISLAKQLRVTNFAHSVSNQSVHLTCAQQPIKITEEQLESVLEACLPNCLSIIQGSAGAGKTTMMKAVVDIYTQHGSKVIGAANTRAAALNLEEQTQIMGHTITRLLGLLDSSSPPIKKNDVLIVDEAGQIGTFQILELMRHACQKGFKLLLVGEDKQLDAISHGGVLRYLSSQNIIGTTRIETIQRQGQAWDRQAVADFRDGLAEKAIIQYRKREQLVFGKNHNETLSLMIDAWKTYTGLNPEKPYLMMAHRWETVNQINEVARAHLKEIGLVGCEDIKVHSTVSNSSISFQVSVGERIRLTRNDYKNDFTNGHVGTVVTIKQLPDDSIVMSIRLDSGRTIQVNTSEYCDEERRAYLVPAYAQTVYSSQGLTIQGQTFIYYSSSMDRANTYVACSRHKEKATIFANVEDLAEYIPSSHEHAPTLEKKLVAALTECMSHENRPKLASEYISPKKEQSVEPESIDNTRDALSLCSLF